MQDYSFACFEASHWTARTQSSHDWVSTVENQDVSLWYFVAICNGDGICKNCACIKEKRTCTTCLPLRRGKCLNTKQSVASTNMPVQPPTSDNNLPTHAAVADDVSSASAAPPTDMDTLSPAISTTNGLSPSNAHPLTSQVQLLQLLLPNPCYLTTHLWCHLRSLGALYAILTFLDC